MMFLGKTHNAWHRVTVTLESNLDSSDPTSPCIGLGGILVNGSTGPDGQLPPALLNLGTTSTGTNQKSTRGHSNQQQDGNHQIATGQGGSIAGSGATNDIFPAELNMPNVTYSQECSFILGKMYELLHEEDYWAGTWQQQAHFNETSIGIAYEQMGNFEQAKSAFELAMSKARDDYGDNNPAPHMLNGRC